MKATMPKVQGDDDDLLEDSDDDEDDLPSDFGGSDELDVSGKKEKDAEGDQDEEEEDGLSLAEASDNEDLISLDGDVPYGLIEYDGSDAEADVNDVFANDEEWGGISSENNKKRKREEDKRGKRKKLRSLPTFASYEDYAKLIEEGLEDDI
jgi:ribosome biogenesis protein MAK21